ncbi:MAG: amino acid ABC transporter ATP-binding protein [Alphaproteobacteria bacterium]
MATSKIIISIDKVNKWFGKFHALKNIDLHIAVGEKVVMCGPSGSGKSTLIRCINRLETHQSGKIEVDGIVIDSNLKNIHAVRENIGMVFQHFNLFSHLTALENCALALIWAKKKSKSDAEKIAKQYLTLVQIPEQANKYPSQLSGGQQQRVAIARALSLKPKIMLFDEPTSALDPEMIAEVLDVMKDLADRGMTMLVITHEMAFARKVADRIIFMDGGEIIEQNPPEEFFNNSQSPRTQLFLKQILKH